MGMTIPTLVPSILKVMVAIVSAITVFLMGVAYCKNLSRGSSSGECRAEKQGMVVAAT